MNKIFFVFFVFALFLFSISAQESLNEETQLPENAESGEGEVTIPEENAESGEGEVTTPEENAESGETSTGENNETGETGETETGETGEMGENGEVGEDGETSTEEGTSTPDTEEDDSKFEEEAEPNDVYPVGSLGSGDNGESDSQGGGSEVVVIEEGENGETDLGQLENGEHDLIIDIGGTSSSSKLVASLGALCLGLLVHFMAE